MLNLMNIDHFLEFTREELLLSTAEIALNSRFRELRTWSSLNALILISRINEETNVLLSAQDLAACQTIEDIFNLIQSKNNGTV